MRRLILTLLTAILVACATGAPTPNAAALKAYQTIDAYVLLIENAVDRGRIDKASAIKASAQAKKARATVEEAEAMLAGCKVAPCADGTAILQSVQPLLLEYERQLRAQQGATK